LPLSSVSPRQQKGPEWFPRLQSAEAISRVENCSIAPLPLTNTDTKPICNTPISPNEIRGGDAVWLGR